MTQIEPFHKAAMENLKFSHKVQDVRVANLASLIQNAVSASLSKKAGPAFRQALKDFVDGKRAN